MRKTLITALIAGCLASAAGASVKPMRGHELMSEAKLTLVQARAVALKARAGQIVDQELEKEAGGSGLRYSFDVKSHGKTYEVGVDAVTGKILENGAESTAKEAQEAVTEKAEKLVHKH